jgi:NADH pyrophosphatase NudC (nudix superfamily)
MTVMEICGLMSKYAICPNCGRDAVGNGNGTIEVNTIDTNEGYFKRTCPCGWCVEIKDSDLKDGF